MIEDELRAAFARHEHLAPSVEALRSRLDGATARRRRRRATSAGAVLAAVAAVAAIATVPSLAGRPASGPAGTTQATAHQTPAAVPARTILLLGSDERPGADGARADTVMLLHLPAGGRRAYLLSLPRDLRLHGDASGCDRLYCPFTRGGAQAERDAVTRLTGIPVDAVVTVRFAGLAALVDAVGGVDITIEQTFKSFATGRTYLRGRQHLTGAQAADYVRERRGLGSGSDVERIARDQRFLAALFTRVAAVGASGDPARLTALLATAGQGIVVGPGVLDLAAAARDYGGLRPADVVGLTVPARTAGAEPYLVLDGGARKLFDAVRQDRLDLFERRHPALVRPLNP